MAKVALIFGVSGQDGAYLASLLVAKGYRVCGTSRDPSHMRGNLSKIDIAARVELRALDLARAHDVLALLREIAPAEIYNLSGQSSPGASFELAYETVQSIALGTLSVLDSMRRLDYGGRFLNAASSECFADVGERPVDESTEQRPRNPYGAAKAAAAQLTACYRDVHGLHASTAYLFNHESPLRDERFVTQKVVRAACRIAAGGAGPLKLGNLDLERDWGWAPDYVEAMWRMLQQERPGDFVIGSGRSVTLRQFVELAFGAVGLDWREHVQIDPTLFRANEPAVVRSNPEKAARLLGWRASHRVEDLVREMVQACRGGAAHGR
jgi:GDPmannose 4,6-dehydratase